MKSTLFKTKIGLATIISCLSTTTSFLAAHADDVRSDLNRSIAFPAFDDGTIAFPGAEGYGKNATGARGCNMREVYHVTNLNDQGVGSFRDAVSQPGRIVVFDVSGIIHSDGTPIVLKSNQTILGHTAPGDGVVLYNARVSASNAENLIVRYLRIRLGAGVEGNKDACGVASGTNMIFDHCSVTWGKDENFSISGSSKGGVSPKDITIQNSIIGQGLQNHSCGGLIQTGIDEGITLFRNLYIDNKTRNPKVKGLNQFVNNVVYNWGNGTAYNMGGNSVGQSETTIENNYMIEGPCNNWQNVANPDGTIVTRNVPMKPAKPFTGGNIRFRSYCVGNYYDHNKDGLLNGVEITTDNWEQLCEGSPAFLAAPSVLHPAIHSQTSALDAYRWIVKYAGASLPVRDEVDRYLIEELTSLGAKGTIIQDERNTEQFPIGGPGMMNTAEKLPDADNDGMPDAFEDAWGLDKHNPKDATETSTNGYLNIENYAFSLEYPAKYAMK